ncbi:MAG: hypothetical protein ACRD9R_20050, partial [Pyrinomonadaceae bacterium]
LSALLLLLFTRGRLIELSRWLDAEQPPLINVAHALTLAALFFASAQAFNSVLPEQGLLRGVLGFFFLWTLWNNLFSAFDARRLLRSVAVLLATAFVVKHLLLAALYAPDSGWLKQVAGALVEGLTQGTLGRQQQQVAPATGYISFFTLALYVGGLFLLPAAPGNNRHGAPEASEVLERYRRLPAEEQRLMRVAISRPGIEPPVAENQVDAILIEGELVSGPAEDTARSE